MLTASSAEMHAATCATFIMLTVEPAPWNREGVRRGEEFGALISETDPHALTHTHSHTSSSLATSDRRANSQVTGCESLALCSVDVRISARRC